VTEVAWHASGKETQNFAILIIDAQEAWRALKDPVFKVDKKIVYMRSICTDRPPDGIPDPYYTGGNATAIQGCFCTIHPAKLSETGEVRNGWFGSARAFRVPASECLQWRLFASNQIAF
jgi:hypothetical protein